MSEVGVDFESIKDFSSPQGCGIADGVRVAGTTVALNRPVIVTCDLASTLVAFELNVVQPLSQRFFGTDVIKIYHAGAYDCRPMRGHPQGLSEHAKGRAIDLLGFDLADGRRITVEHDWDGGGRAEAFLHALARRACAVFSVVLTPDHDHDHRDHIHVDVGPFKLCGVVAAQNSGKPAPSQQ